MGIAQFGPRAFAGDGGLGLVVGQLAEIEREIGAAPLGAPVVDH